MTIEQVRDMTGQEFEFYATSSEDGSVVFCLPIPNSEYMYWTDEDGKLVLPGNSVEAAQYLAGIWKAYMKDFLPVKQYRISAKAGESDKLPKNVPSITKFPYEASMTFRPCDGNHMVMLDGDITKDLEYKDNKLYYREMEISQVDQNGQLYSADMCDMPVVAPEHGFPSSDTDLEIIRYLYGIILLKYSEDIEDIAKRINDDPNQFLSYSIKIYLPKFMRAIGMSPNMNRANALRAVAKIHSYSRYWGITKTILPGWNRPLYGYYPAISAIGYTEANNMLTLTSPYLNYVVQQTIMASLKRDKKGNLLRSRSGSLLKEPTHSYHVRASIMKE